MIYVQEGRKNILKGGGGGCEAHTLPWWCSVCWISLDQSVPKPAREKKNVKS